jgi:hypothetical protein
VNSVKSAGLLFTGLLPFWRNARPHANAAQLADILNSPIEQGLELIYPDLTVKQLIRLDDQMLRDGLIIKNNSQVRTLAFVPKDLLNLSHATGKEDKENSRRSDATIRAWQNDPQYVNQKLGTLVLVGQTIVYTNRVQLLVNPAGGPVSPQPTITGINPPTVEQGAKDEPMSIPGAYLDKATLTLKDPDSNEPVKGVKFSAISSDASGHMLEVKLSVEPDVAPKKYKLVASTTGGSDERTFEIIQARPSFNGAIAYDGGSAPKEKSEEQKVGITIKGTNFDNAKLILPTGWTTDGDPTVGPAQITAKIVVPKGTKKGFYDIKVKNSNPNAATVKFEVQ